MVIAVESWVATSPVGEVVGVAGVVGVVDGDEGVEDGGAEELALPGVLAGGGTAALEAAGVDWARVAGADEAFDGVAEACGDVLDWAAWVEGDSLPPPLLKATMIAATTTIAPTPPPARIRRLRDWSRAARSVVFQESRPPPPDIAPVSPTGDIADVEEAEGIADVGLGLGAGLGAGR
ncbi:hypothetical protein ACFQ9X_27650 [Catenulispora yoronensis]